MEPLIVNDLDESGDDEDGNHAFVDENPNWVEGWANPFVVVNPVNPFAENPFLADDGFGGGAWAAQAWGDWGEGWNFSPATSVSGTSSGPVPSYASDEEGEVVGYNPVVNPLGGGSNAENEVNGGLMGEIRGNQELNAGIGGDEQANQGLIGQNIGENAGLNGGADDLIEEVLNAGIEEIGPDSNIQVEELGQIQPRVRISLGDLFKANNIDDDEETREDDEPRQRESDAVWIKKPMGYLCCGCGSQRKKVSSQEEDFET